MRRYSLIAAALAVLLIAAPILASSGFSGKVRTIEDGDSLTISTKGRWVDVNIAGIIAPTRSQHLGREAQEFLKGLAKKQNVKVDIVKKSINGTAIANVTLEDGRDLATLLIEAGYARATSNATDAQRSAAKRAQASAIGVYGPASVEAGS